MKNKDSETVFSNLNILDYIGAVLLVAGPAIALINLYIADFTNAANETDIRYAITVGEIPNIAFVSIKTYIFCVLLSAIGFVFLSWGRKAD